MAVTDGVLVELDRLRGIVRPTCRPGSSASARAPRCTSSTTRSPHWASRCRTSGDIDRQTISGAIGTGTHGTGARFRGLADAVRGVRIVLADGSVHDCDAGNEPDLFEAARVGLGALGIITELTLQCVPAFLLQAREDPGTLSGTLADLDDLVDGTDHFEFYWFPHTDRVLTKRNTRLPVEAGEHPLPGLAGVARRRPPVEPRVRGGQPRQHRAAAVGAAHQPHHEPGAVVA